MRKKERAREQLEMREKERKGERERGVSKRLEMREEESVSDL